MSKTQTKEETMRKAMVGAELAVVIFIGMGFGWISGLMAGDAQAQKLANAGLCDGNHYVITYVPRFIKDGSGIERVQYKVPCNRWVEGEFPVKPRR